VTGVKDQFLSLNIVNAGDSSYPEGWVDYNACCSYDRTIWFRVPTTYDAETGVLTIRHKPEHSSLYFAYFAPYSHDKHMRLVAAVQVRPSLLCHGDQIHRYAPADGQPSAKSLRFLSLSGIKPTTASLPGPFKLASWSCFSRTVGT
jgi:murein tripeptide amidase MpaA